MQEETWGVSRPWCVEKKCCPSLSFPEFPASPPLQHPEVSRPILEGECAPPSHPWSFLGNGCRVRMRRTKKTSRQTFLHCKRATKQAWKKHHPPNNHVRLANYPPTPRHFRLKMSDWELRGAVNGNAAKNPNLSNKTSRQVTRGKDAHALMSAQDLLEPRNKQNSTATWKEGRAALCPAGCGNSAVSCFSSKTVYRGSWAKKLHDRSTSHIITTSLSKSCAVSIAKSAVMVPLDMAKSWSRSFKKGGRVCPMG